MCEVYLTRPLETSHVDNQFACCTGTLIAERRDRTRPAGRLVGWSAGNRDGTNPSAAARSRDTSLSRCNLTGPPNQSAGQPVPLLSKGRVSGPDAPGSPGATALNQAFDSSSFPGHQPEPM